MTAPGDATNVGSIVGYLTLNRADWIAGVGATKRDAAEIGRLSPDIRIDTNAADVLGQLALVQAAEDKVGSSADKAKPFVMNLWAALAAVAPAAVPITAVAGGALIGLLPTVAAVTLGISGIREEMKSGALEGTQYGHDIEYVKNWLDQLKTTAASGLLDGVDQAVTQSRPLFGAITGDVRVFSNELGDIVGGAAPALLTILHQLEPLFATIGGDLASGAQHLERWAQSSDGVSKFVAYVQTELPDVEHLLGNLITLLAHLAEGAAPFGGALLADISAFVRVLDAIPVGVLQTAVPAAVSLYFALKAYQGLTAVIAGVNAAIVAMGKTITVMDGQVAATNLQFKASALATEAAAAQEAASVAEAAAQEKLAFAAKQEAAAQWGAAFEETAAQVAIDAEAEAAALRAAALQIAADADAAAAGVVAAGEEASVGWAGFLGPIGAAAVGVGLFTTALLHSHSAAVQERAEINALTDAIKQDSGAVGENTKAYVINALQKSGALDDARKLGISLQLVTQAALGNKGALDDVTASALQYSYGLYGATQDTHDHVAAAKDLMSILTGTSGDLAKAKQAYDNEKAAAGGATGAINAQKSAIDSERAALQKLNQQLETNAQLLLARAQSEDQFKESVFGVVKQLKGEHDQLNTTTQKGLANRDAILASAQAALSLRDAQEKAGKSVKSANETLADNIQQLMAAAVQAGANKNAVHDLVAQMGLLPKDIRTEIDTTAKQAMSDVDALQAAITGLHGTDLLIRINEINTSGVGQAGAQPGSPHSRHAAGGPVTGPGPVGVDSVLDLNAPGEWVINAHAVAALTAKYGPDALPMINQGALPAPKPLTVPSAPARYATAATPASVPTAAAQPVVNADDLRAALHGARFVLDAGGVGTLTGHIEATAGAVVRDYAVFQDDLYGG